MKQKQIYSTAQIKAYRFNLEKGFAASDNQNPFVDIEYGGTDNEFGF